MRQLTLALVTAASLGAPAAALAAGKITTLAANPAVIEAGGTTTLAIGHSGPKCGYKIHTGTGEVLGPFAVQGASANATVVYPAQGAFTIQVVGKKKGNHPKCDVVATPVGITVTAAGGRSTSNTLGSKAKQGLGKARPGFTDPALATKGLKPKAPAIDELRPRIESLLFVQGPLGFATPGVLAPSGKLIVRGARFGAKKGTLFLKGQGSAFPQYPSGKIPLSILSWEQDRVEGRIPMGMTKPLDRVPVEVHLRSATDALSNGFDREFQVPVETRVLGASDAGVLECASYATSNFCGDDETHDATLHGYHKNGFGVAGGGPGTDRFSITLHDGWVFSRVTKVEKSISGDDGDYVKDLHPPLPIGKDHWVGGIETNASSDDSVLYRVWIEVKRAKGAH